MALTPIFSRTRVVTTADHGNTLVYGNASDGQVGGWEFDCVPDGQWEGELVIVGRGYSKDANDDDVGFVPIPYRKVFLNEAPADWSMVSTAISGRSIIVVPATGLSVGITVACTAGTCALYSRVVEGSVAP